MPKKTYKMYSYRNQGLDTIGSNKLLTRSPFKYFPKWP